MALIKGGTTLAIQDVDTYKKGGRAALVPRGAAYVISAITGTIAAALGANSSVFAMRLDPAAGATFKAQIDRILMQYTTIVAYTTPVTAARRLALFRGSGAAASGGTAITAAVKKDTADGASQVTAAEGGDARIATTAALTVAGITFETDPVRTMTLTHVGAAGGFLEQTWEFDPARGPLILNQGELIAIRNPVAMDAAGTWQLAVTVEWQEGVL